MKFSIKDFFSKYAVLHGLKILAILRIIIQKKPIRIISFQPQNSHSSPFSQENNM